MFFKRNILFYIIVFWQRNNFTGHHVSFLWRRSVQWYRRSCSRANVAYSSWANKNTRNQNLVPRTHQPKLTDRQACKGNYLSETAYNLGDVVVPSFLFFCWVWVYILAHRSLVLHRRTPKNQCSCCSHEYISLASMFTRSAGSTSLLHCTPCLSRVRDLPPPPEAQSRIALRNVIVFFHSSVRTATGSL